MKAIVDTVATAQSVPATTLKLPGALGLAPLIALRVEEGTEEIVDSISNTEDATFTIYVIDAKKDDSADETIETRIYTIMDALKDAFRTNANFTLGGLVYSFLVTQWKGVKEEKMGNTPVLFGEIEVEAKALKEYS